MKEVTFIILLLLHCFSAYSQNESTSDSLIDHKSEVIEVYFDHNSHEIDLGIKQNRESLFYFSELMEKLNSDTQCVISKIEINSSTSPEGGRVYNQELSERRSNAIYKYLIETQCLPDSIINKNSSGTDWDRLQSLVEASEMQYKDEVLYILRNVPEEKWERLSPNSKWPSMVDSRNKQLMELRYGVPYHYMMSHIFPELRKGSVVTAYTSKATEPLGEAKEGIEKTYVPQQESKIEQELEHAVEIYQETKTKPLFAIKTNLLFDVVTLLNAEVEVPIMRRWSIACEWVFPWWTFDNGKSDSKRNRIQLLNGNVEGKYWFGNRAERPVMTGWFAGLYAGGGLYDFERNAKGYQGEFFLAAGASLGYAHTINRTGTLRMEYSLGGGYLKTDYRYYESEYDVDDKWHPRRRHSGAYTWIGPTKAKVSLVWLLNYKSKNGGRR